MTNNNLTDECGMTAFTREQIIAHITARLARIAVSTFPVSMKPQAQMDKQILESALRALQEYRKAAGEPVAWLNDAYLGRGVVDGEAGSEDAGPGYIPVYRHPQNAAPAVEAVPVVAELESILYWILHLPVPTHSATLNAKRLKAVIDSFRAAMQQPVSNRDELSVMPDFEGVDLTQRECYQVGKARDLPDGWVMVPVEPTRKMLDAFRAAYEKDESYAEHWKRMIAAAPQQEVNGD